MNKILLQINSVANSGSTGRITEQMGLVAQKHGWKSYIAYGRYANKSQSDLIRIGNKLDQFGHLIQTRLFDKHCLASTGATRSFIRQLDVIKPDLVHIHNIHGYYLDVRVLFEYLSSNAIPVVWTFHDCWPITGHCAHYANIGCEKWKTECYECPQTKHYPASLGKDRSRENFQLKKELFNTIENMSIVAMSQWLGNQIKESFLSTYPIDVILNGIDLEVFRKREVTFLREKKQLQNKFIILGVASQWGAGKGLNDFITLSDKLNSDEKIILVGLSASQIRNLPANIIGIEKTESVHELADYYSLADVFVTPTYSDSLPITHFEAQACGTPVITYDTDGSSESITNKTGLVVEKGNVNAIRQGLDTIKAKGKLFYESACIERAANHYDKNDRYHDYIKLYEDLIYKQNTHHV